MSTSYKRFRSSFHKAAILAAAGFTLIELLMVVAVITIITAFILSNQGRFNSATLLRSFAYSVALSLRQAQLYGSSVRGTMQSGLTTFNAGYGINFSVADTGHYYLFADRDNNGCRSGDSYTCNGVGVAGGEDLSTFSLNSPYVISDLCVLYAGNTLCSAACPSPAPLGGAGCTPSAISALTVVFHRPNPEACITDNAGLYCATGAVSPFAAAYIQIQNTADPSNTRSITVTQTGEIQVCGLANC